MIAQAVVEQLEGNEMFSKTEMVKPGFINLNLSAAFLAQCMNEMNRDTRLGVEQAEKPLSIVVDYGGPNVAKPLHVGHLRSAVIGEAIKRTARFMGHNVVGDTHLGDWGLQIGQIITEMRERTPDLPYFDENYSGAYPVESPVTIADLEEIYPCASKKSKSDEAYKAAAQQAVSELQAGRRGYRALWKHILDVSVADLKRNYEKLDVSFDLWLGESDAQPLVADMVAGMKESGLAYLSDGALVVDVTEEDDKVEVPPCMILKSNGASQYETTDLATIVQRRRDFNPDRIIYLADKRQEQHFLRVFRCAYKTGLVDRDKCALEHIGFGAMNGRDGAHFSTREGGVMRLEYLIREVTDAVYEKSKSGSTGAISDEELHAIAAQVALAAVKYGDLSNQPSKDYVFDLDRFTATEGNTGPYILYTMVRIKSILAKYAAAHPESGCDEILAPEKASETELMLTACKFNEAVYQAYEQNAPNKLCRYIYELTGVFNQFYNECNIMKEADAARQRSYVTLSRLILHILECAVHLLGFSAPERM